MRSYINSEKEYTENPLIDQLGIPANLRIDDFDLFAAPKGRVYPLRVYFAEAPLLDPFLTPVKQLPVFNMKTGEKTSDLVTLNNRVFGMPLREDILQRVVVWQLAKRRQGTHCVKTLSEVSGSNRKPFPQKGTGRARQGQKRYESMRSARMQSSSDARRLQADGTASA